MEYTFKNSYVHTLFIVIQDIETFVYTHAHARIHTHTRKFIVLGMVFKMCHEHDFIKFEETKSITHHITYICKRPEDDEAFEKHKHPLNLNIRYETRNIHLP